MKEGPFPKISGTALESTRLGAGGATAGREPHLVRTVRKYTISGVNLLTYFVEAGPQITQITQITQIRG